MGVVDDIMAMARRASPRIVLAEDEDSRVVQAAIRAANDGVAKVTVVANEKAFDELAKDIPGRDQVTVHDPATSDRLDAYTDAYYQLRRHKGITRDDAEAVMRTPLAFAAMMAPSAVPWRQRRTRSGPPSSLLARRLASRLSPAFS